MGDDLAGWFLAAVERAKREGRWDGFDAVADRAGVSRQLLYRLGNGARTSPRNLAAIARALGTDAPEIVAVVGAGSVSAATVESLRLAIDELAAVARRLEAVEAELARPASEPGGHTKAQVRAAREAGTPGAQQPPRRHRKSG